MLQVKNCSGVACGCRSESGDWSRTRPGIVALLGTVGKCQPIKVELGGTGSGGGG